MTETLPTSTTTTTSSPLNRELLFFRTFVKKSTGWITRDDLTTETSSNVTIIYATAADHFVPDHHFHPDHLETDLEEVEQTTTAASTSHSKTVLVPSLVNLTIIASSNIQFRENSTTAGDIIIPTFINSWRHRINKHTFYHFYFYVCK